MEDYPDFLSGISGNCYVLNFRRKFPGISQFWRELRRIYRSYVLMIFCCRLRRLSVNTTAPHDVHALMHDSSSPAVYF